MILIGEPAADELDNSGDVTGFEDGGRTVVVGVRLDTQSKELLTWALVKVAQSGDRVIALHVLNSAAAEKTSSLLSLVKTFDSILAVYEGFCNLKQVDLKLKVCRGTSIKKALIREARSHVGSTLIMGTSRAYHSLHSSTSVAKYCAKKLPKCITVLAVDNGKVLFQREAKSGHHDSRQCHKKCTRSLHSSFKNLNALHDMHAAVMIKSDQVKERHLQKSESLCEKGFGVKQCLNCSLNRVFPGNSDNQLMELLSPCDDIDNNSLALVPILVPEAYSNSASPVSRELAKMKSGWLLLRRFFLHDQQPSEKYPRKRMSMIRRVLRLPISHSSSVVYPDQRRLGLFRDEDHGSILDEVSGAIVPVGYDAMPPPLSPDQDVKSLPEELRGLPDKYSSSCRLFRYQELLSATSNFRPGNLVGRGGSSQVYRGCLPDGKDLAVKILKQSENGLKEFISEIEFITSLSHKNIISLHGFCFEDNKLLVVYDFLSRGSLEENLYGDREERSFGWVERYKVALGVAEALDYLHNGCAQPVIHRDVKSSNILLADDFEPQLSDFGLAAWASNSSEITYTDVAGTFGYLAPEYFMYGKVNHKIDVYAFGVVLLELLSGRKPIDCENPKGEESLIMWAKPLLKDGKISQLLDPSLSNTFDGDTVERMVMAATLCLTDNPRSRPQINLVLKLLQGDMEVVNWARQEAIAIEEVDSTDEAAFPSNIQSHLNLALRDLEDNSFSGSNLERSVSIEDYLQGRWNEF